MSISRNDPCPCGSGKKYKHCCLLKIRSKPRPDEDLQGIEEQLRPINKDPDWAKLRATEGDITEALNQFVAEELGKNVFSIAWNEFTIRDAYPIKKDQYAVHFEKWLLYSWILPSFLLDEDEKLTVFELFMKRHPLFFNEYQKRFLKAVKKLPFNYYLIQDVIYEQRLFLKDIMLGHVIEVKECRGSRVMPKGSLLYARLLNYDDQSILLGIAPFAIPNRYFDSFVSYRLELLRREKVTSLTPEILFKYEDESRFQYFALMEEAFKPMKLKNHDGEDILFIEMYYDLLCPAREVFEALKTLNPEEHQSNWEDAEFDEHGNLIEKQLNWSRVNAPEANQILPNTAIASFTIKPNELKIFVNSTERAKGAKQAVEKLLGSKIRFRNQQSRDPMSEGFEKKSKDKTAREKIMPTEEAIAMLKEIVANQWKKWPDAQLSALGGLTPREAAKSAIGREKLEALFLDVEHQNDCYRREGEDYQCVDIEYIKKEIGLIS